MATPKDECEALLDATLAVAEELLATHGEFSPFGATMSSAGDIAPTAPPSGNDRPEPDELIELLTEGFRNAAAAGTVRATALVFDAQVTPPGKALAEDAIAVHLDHREHY